MTITPTLAMQAVCVALGAYLILTQSKGGSAAPTLLSRIWSGITAIWAKVPIVGDGGDRAPVTIKTTLSRVQLWEELYAACAPELCCPDARVLLDQLWVHIAPAHKHDAPPAPAVEVPK